MGRQHIAATNTSMPTFAEWERFSGGTKGRDLPLLKFIDKRMYEHSILTRQVAQFHAMKTERKACLIQLWNATRLYLKSAGGAGTFSRGKRGLVRADAGRVVDLGAGGRHNRSDAIGALHGIAADELMVLMDATNEADLKVKIRASAVHGLDPLMRDTVDHNASGELVAAYLDRDERAQHRVVFENGKAWMHPRDPSKPPLGWAEANTCDWLPPMAASRNPCSKELRQLLRQSAVGEEPLHGDTSGAAGDYYNQARRVDELGIDGYVMSHGRKFYMSPDHRNGEFFHSAYTAGESVVCSGSVTFKGGVPKILTNLSGHYKPTPDKIDRVINLFEMAGVPVNGLQILAVTPLKKHYFYASIADFRRALTSGLA